MTSENIPQRWRRGCSTRASAWMAFLLEVNVVLLLAGNVMEPSSIVLTWR